MKPGQGFDGFRKFPVPFGVLDRNFIIRRVRRVRRIRFEKVLRRMSYSPLLQRLSNEEASQKIYLQVFTSPHMNTTLTPITSTRTKRHGLSQEEP